MAATRTSDYAVRALVALALDGESGGQEGGSLGSDFGHPGKIYGASFAMAAAGRIRRQSPGIGGWV